MSMSFAQVSRLAFACAALSACDQVGEVSSTELGGVGFKFSLPSTEGIAVETLDYTISGPKSFHKQGSLALDKNQRSRIEGLPVERGYAIKLASRGSTPCAGASNFDIAADSLTSVTVRMQCGGTPSVDESVMVNGKSQLCPVVQTATATPSADGKAFVLSGLAHVRDMQAGAPTYKWTVSRGQLSGTNATEVTLTCPEGGGDVSMTFEVGAADTTCSDKQALPIVNCRVGGV